MQNFCKRIETINKQGIHTNAATIHVVLTNLNAKIDEIMVSYPPGKKNKIFTLRYGSPESIKQMNMNAIFTLLNMFKPKKLALIESLDYFGNDTQSKKSRPSQQPDETKHAGNRGVALATLFTTIGPFDVAAVFAALTSQATPTERRSYAVRGILIASVIF